MKAINMIKGRMYTGEFFGISKFNCKLITNYTWNNSAKLENIRHAQSWSFIRRLYETY